MTTHERRVQKTNALLAVTSCGQVVLIDEMTTFTRVQLTDSSWSEWDADLPHWQFGTMLLTAGEASHTLISPAGEIFKLVTAY
ncbi:MAG TPA: hypothetical protein VMR43_18620 [Variovorax sp.]|nr:hypothetical protein [Variovorax sp.]